MNETIIEGVIAAVPTPFLDDGTPDLERFIDHCRWAFANGADGLNVLGTTGEANSQNTKARKQIMKAAAENLDPAKLMVGTATPDLETTVELTRYASDLGYPVALVLPPYYYKPVTDNGLFGWFEDLDRRLGSSSIELYLYNFPALTGIGFPLDLIARLAKELKGRVTGIKDSSADLPYCRDIVEKIPGFKVFPSSETCLGAARSDGFAGCISASVNVTAPLAQKLWQASAGTADAETLQSIVSLRTQIASVPLIAAVKYLISQREKSPQWEAVRLPQETLNNNQKDALSEAASRLGYV
ncbi:dihydrodipicolinate synthase family protein [Sneathiella marina]|uniref:Dihydrodipicolinate synthase family protein n=1 Tax=Sneathiella marina TaxID=2950108 RepID=A0ABY4W178_9PROT|nr:dihydrodipicolinate synthase family protein [Sneathiella marina]USG60921.1 dihydrodipicolinate synthase family protein [Sneathiella marina]